MSDYTARLTHLKQNESNYPTAPDVSILETFDNRHPDREYEVTFECPEFTALCPITSQPDFGKIYIQYVPGERCVESKSLKLYLFSYRNHNSFHEEVCNLILDDFVAVCSPRQATVIGEFNARGGISIHVEASYEAPAG